MSYNGHMVARGLTPLGLRLWERLRMRWATAWERLVPFGYQDETGFHYGQP